ncbi:MAG: hypothetical protein AB1499_00875 [Nitrospirota bacterium]
MNSKTYSLLPYLEAERGGFHMDVTLISGDGAAIERSPFPFLTITDTDPLSQIIEARIRTDAGSGVERVFLLLQRDSYLLAKDDLWPVTNRDVEEAWQKAFPFHSSENRDNTFVRLAGQMDDQGKPVQLASLFYCKTRRLFFHPPCPKCGSTLGLCKDDDLLSGAGLQSYSGSLKRYLYCATCTSTGRQEFYSFEPEQTETQVTRDRASLIRKFKLLIEGNKNIDGFPCIGCPNYKDCYGSEQRVLSRIVPFAFYPFHLLVFKAPSLYAADFLSLVSGAAAQEIETELEKKGEYGRSTCLKNVRQENAGKAPLLFDEGDANFLEVLYLKLTFLAETFQGISRSSSTLRHPDLRPSLDQIWVKLPEQSSRLPYLWDFRVKFMGVFSQSTGRISSADLPAANSLFFMGLVFFHALLVNRRQDILKVYEVLMELINMSSSDSGFSFNDYVQQGVSPTLFAVNIFRAPEGKEVNKAALPLWEKALASGWSVLNAGYRPSDTFSPDNFLEQLDELRREVRDRLFAAPTGYEKQPAREDEKAISEILKKIYDKWSSAEEEASTETVVLTPKAAEIKSAPPAEENEALAGTVIISPGVPPASGPAVPVQPDKEDEILTETVIISPQAMKDTLKPSEAAAQKKPDTVPPETVIISAKDAAATLRPEASPAAESSAAAGPAEQKKKKEQDFLAETLIIRPGELKGKGKK